MAWWWWWWEVGGELVVEVRAVPWELGEGAQVVVDRTAD